MAARHTIWRWAGIADDTVGRLKVLFVWVPIIVGGIGLVVWAWLLHRFGLLGTIVLVVGLLVAALGVIGAIQTTRWSREPTETASPPPIAPKPYLHVESPNVAHAAIREFPRPGFGDALIDPPTSAASYSTSQTLIESVGGTIPSLDYAAWAAPDPVELYKSPCFARVNVTNDPGGLAGLTAEKVVASVRFYDEEGNPLLDGPMQGRWSESKQPHERDRIGITLDHLEAEIFANGLAHPLDVAMKHPDDEDCFAYNDENSNAHQGRLESHRLKGESFRVDVTVRAANAGHQEQVTRSFTLVNPGAGHDLEIAPFALRD